MENKIIPTAEEFLKKNFSPHTGEGTGDIYEYYYPEDVLEIMIEFAKLHCEAQVKAINENVEINDYDEHFQYSPHVDKDSILKSYPLENVK